MILKNQDVEVNQASATTVVKEINAITAQGEAFSVASKQRDGIAYTAFDTLPKNLGELYRRAADNFSGNDFLVFNEERISFSDLYDRANAFAHALSNEYDLKKGDRVALAMRNYPEWIVAFMGVTLSGGVAVPLNAWWQAAEFDYALDHSEPILLVSDDKRAKLIAPLLAKRDIEHVVARSDIADKASLDMADLLTRYSSYGEYESSVEATDRATIFYTSGSTGAPKGAVSTHEAILSAINTWLMLGTAAAIANGPAPEDKPLPVALMTVPLFHVTGCHTLFLLSLISGRKTVIMPYWDATLALELIERERVTYFNGVPTMSMELMQHPERDQYDLSSLLDVCAGGAARPPEHVRKVADSFPQGLPSCGYGLTETNALGAVNGPREYLLKPTSAGLPTPPIVEVTVFDEQGVELEQGQVGEIAIKTIANIEGYWRDELATKKAFRDGYFLTGDLGFVDEDGFLFIVDRAKEIIIRGGENISCLEVEAALYSHPDVAEASVFSLPDARLGEVVGAVVYSKVAAHEGLIEELKAFCSKTLAHFKVPEHVWVIPQQLPRLGSGKIDRNKLKGQYRDALLAREAEEAQ